jgi:TrmH family RNA methyltransferase
MRLHRSRGRAQAGATLLEGPHLVGAAIDAGHRLGTVFATSGDAVGTELARRGGAELLAVDDRTLQRLGTTEAPQSPIAVMAVPTDQPPPGGRVIVAWGLADPGNCGTLIRIAAAFGYGFLAGPGSAELWSPKVLRAAAGAHFTLRLGRVDTLEAVRAGGRTIVATVARGGMAPGTLPASAAILVGNEAHGLAAEIVSAADMRVTIPTSGAVESLNAAVAGAIVAYLGVAGPGTNLSAS